MLASFSDKSSVREDSRTLLIHTQTLYPFSSPKFYEATHSFCENKGCRE